MPNVGRTHGERIEQAWADLGRAKYITWEMTPGHRKDTLYVFFSHRNWKMLCNDGKYLETLLWVADLGDSLTTNV